MKNPENIANTIIKDLDKHVRQDADVEIKLWLKSLELDMANPHIAQFAQLTKSYEDVYLVVSWKILMFILCRD